MATTIDSQFVELVNEAYKVYGSILALSRSPLAHSLLVTPVLVLDPLTPTAEERGRGLQLLLRWALEQLAPAKGHARLGEHRPWDDPTWREPAWWRYNILRHRYVEPIHPDDFVDGGRYTETLMALTGIASPDTFFDERNRAVRDAASVLQQQMQTGYASDELQQAALLLACTPLSRRPEEHLLLRIAAVFEGIFPRTLLLALAAAEHLSAADAVLDRLIADRFLLSGDEGANLWTSPPLRAYLYRHDDRQQQRIRHERAAAFYAREHDIRLAAHHYRLAGQWQTAADLLLANPVEMAGEVQPDALRAELEHFAPGTLDDERWRRLQVLRSDLCAACGDSDAAIDACRAALRCAHTPHTQASIFRRMGKLYEMRNQMHALAYYRQAEERLLEKTPEAEAERCRVLKDRGWLHIHRREWDAAAADLSHSLELARANDALRGDVLDALAALHRYRQEYPAAIEWAQQALALREQTGDLLRVARSLGNLGLLYAAIGDYAHAVAAHEEAHAVAVRVGNREVQVTALLNIGLAHHLGGSYERAAHFYRQCLALAREMNFVLAELRAHSNLAEVLAEMNEIDAATAQWRRALELARREGFDDEAVYLHEVAERIGIARDPAEDASSHGKDGAGVRPAVSSPSPATDLLSADDALAIELAQREGQITPRRLMEAANLSKATATRRLTALTAAGLLHQVGRGRGTCYVASGVPREQNGSTHVPERGVDVRALAVSALPPALLAELEQCAVVAAGWVEGAPLLALRFAWLPELLTFLALRTTVRDALGEAVDILPAEALAAEQTVRWELIANQPPQTTPDA